MPAQAAEVIGEREATWGVSDCHVAPLFVIARLRSSRGDPGGEDEQDVSDCHVVASLLLAMTVRGNVTARLRSSRGDPGGDQG